MCCWPSMPGWRGRVCGGVVSWSLSHDVCVWDWRGSCLCISLCVLHVCVRVCILPSLMWCSVCVCVWAHPSTLCFFILRQSPSAQLALGWARDTRTAVPGGLPPF